jgi:hypothetical protein
MNDSSKNKWLSPGFLVASGILLLCALGLNVAIAKLQLHLIKQPVALAKNLDTIPDRMGDWIQVSKDEPLDHELQETLATDKYAFRDYVNTKTLTWDDLAFIGIGRTSADGTPASVLLDSFANKGSLERKQLVSALQLHNPEAVMNLAVTYYTGKVDTVAHIPERCMVADGYQPTDTPETAWWDMGPGRLNSTPGGDQRIAVRFINFQDQTGAKRVTRRVAYFFFCNGKYLSDPISVRTALADLRSRHGFYSKVELMTIIPDHDRCATVMSGFLQSVMPEVEKCFPDWNSVEHPAGK